MDELRLVKYWGVPTPVTYVALMPMITFCHTKRLPLKCHPS